MRRELLMPKLGLTMTEGLVADWMAAPGAAFRQGDGLFVVETDKVANEIPAPGDGTLLEIVISTGETVPVGTVLGYWDDPAAQDNAMTSGRAERLPADAPPAPTSARPDADTAQTDAEAPANRTVATPLARRIARQHGIDLARIQGTGPRGRIVARDVQATQRPTTARTPAAPGQTDGHRLTAPTSLQTTIARRLTQGKQETPHFYLALEAEVSRLAALRREINAAGGDVRLTLNHFIVMAVAQALHQMPEANRVWTADGILAFDQIDVGVAVDTPQGLLAPAVQDAGMLSLGALARALNALTSRVREHGLRPQDMGTPAITVSNAGMHHVTYMTSIINPGQAMILGVGSVKPVFRPDEAGQPALRQEMGLVLSVDHRIMNGVDALKFLNTVVGLLEQPARLLAI